VGKILVLLVFILFTASTLLMPYANYDDTQSLAKVYHNCLSEDPDMDFAEFIAEKLFVSIPEEDEEIPTEQKKSSMPLSVQIQHGVLLQVSVQQLEIEASFEKSPIYFLHNHTDKPYGFRNLVFRPPLV
jgi:hypothetical protein